MGSETINSTRYRSPLASLLTAWLLLSPTGFVGAAVHPSAVPSTIKAGGSLTETVVGALGRIVAQSETYVEHMWRICGVRHD